VSAEDQAPTSSRSARSQWASASPSVPRRWISYARSAICSCVIGPAAARRRLVRLATALFAVVRLVVVRFAVASFGMVGAPSVEWSSRAAAGPAWPGFARRR
jgi:hypothetical protein